MIIKFAAPPPLIKIHAGMFFALTCKEIQSLIRIELVFEIIYFLLIKVYAIN